MNRNNYKSIYNKNYKKICKTNNQNNLIINTNEDNKLNIETINNNGYYYDKIRNIHYNNQCFWISIINYLNNCMNININLTELLNIAKKNNAPINCINEMVTLIDGIKYPYIDAITNVTIEFNLTIHIHYNYNDSNKLIQLLEIGNGDNHVHIININNSHFELITKYNNQDINNIDINEII